MAPDPVLPDEVTVEVVRGWIARAEADLANATLVLAAGPDGPLDTVAFHAQQCAEKYLKALLCCRGVEVPRIHDIEALLMRTGIGEGVDVSVEDSRLLTDYATLTRYPGDYDPVTLPEARHAVALAKRVRRAARRQLPRLVLRGPRGP